MMVLVWKVDKQYFTMLSDGKSPACYASLIHQ